MNLRYPLWIPAVVGLGFSAPAFAQFRCDCTSVVDSCEADVAVRGNWVEITTDRMQCSRVDYFIDGQPFVSVVVDGEDRRDWIPGSTEPRVLVQSCQVCRDSAAAGEGAAGRTPEPRAAQSGEQAQASSGAQTPGRQSRSDDTAGRLEALIEVPPVYPEAAQARGVQGYVELDVTVGPQGGVQNATVKTAEPAGIFDEAALAAVRRWRYPAEPGREPQTVSERIDFRPGAAAAPRAASATSAAPANVTGARNQCVRETSVFNYGEMIEVGLMNACDAPIMVFGCAEGTGRYQGRWVCTTSEQQQSVLVPPGDGRAGSAVTIETPDGQSPATLTDRFFVSRAPNSEYWWVACAIDDADCRANARQWTRSLDKQLASIDPQGRSSVTVARSY